MENHNSGAVAAFPGSAFEFNYARLYQLGVLYEFATQIH
jgi:hypothetical protein